MIPTPEQLAIIEAAVKTKDNILISALAGAAKTTTLELICKALPIQPILSLAFNKRIAEEMSRRLPGHVSCKTLNSIGHTVWARAISRKINLDTKKSYNFLKGKVDVLRRGEKEEAYEVFSETLKAIGTAKLSGYVPKGNGAYPSARRLVKACDFFSALDEEPSDWQTHVIDEVLLESIKLSYDGLIDFDDQIYMPTLFGGTFPRFPVVLIDESQDLSAINHVMLEKLVTGRLIAVGDANQSIYGFRGAVSNGMDNLKLSFRMTEMPLSTSFRCPIEVVKLARKRAPTMNWPSWAKEGRVNVLDDWSPRDIPDNSAIICRNNAPLFSLAFRLIRAGRGCQLVGFDIGPQLVKSLKKLGPETLTQEEVYAAIDAWEAERLRKAKGKAAVKDKAECLRVFAGFGDNLGAAIAYAEHLFKSTGPVQLLSGHKAKGLEWETVFHLDPWRIPSPFAETQEDLEQEANLEYVITTRAKENLFFVDLKNFDGRA